MNVASAEDGGQTLQRKLDVLQRHCTELGRPYEEIERTVTTALGEDESVESLSDRCRQLHELGATHVVLIARGRPFTARDCDVIAAAADRSAEISQA